MIILNKSIRQKTIMTLEMCKTLVVLETKKLNHH